MYESMKMNVLCGYVNQTKSHSRLFNSFIRMHYAYADAGRTRERGADDTFVAEAGRESLIR